VIEVIDVSLSPSAGVTCGVAPLHAAKRRAKSSSATGHCRARNSAMNNPPISDSKQETTSFLPHLTLIMQCIT
jgi:hypothetical protein